MHSVYTLNETGAFIWEHIDGKRSVEEIIAAVTEEYEIDNENASEDVFSFIDDMRKYLIIDPQVPLKDGNLCPPSPLKGG